MDQEDEFGTTCVDCGGAITDETPTVSTTDGDLLHLGCGEPCVCHTAVTCLAHDRPDDEPAASTVAQAVTDRLSPPMTMQISHAEQDHHAMLRQRSYELALQRGHMRR